MDPESVEPKDGQEPKQGEAGQEPNVEPTADGQEPEPKTFDEAYVKRLRKEAAEARKKATEAEQKLQELAQADLTEQERSAAKVSELEREVSRAQAKLTRYEVAADRGLDLKAASFLAGDTREEIEEKADELTRLLAERAKPAPTPGFDGGARQTPAEKTSPEESHNLLLLKATGRAKE